MPRLKPLDIYNYLPKTNCGECGLDSCMAFAYKLIEHEIDVEACKPLATDPKFKKAFEELKELVTPPVRPVKFGGDGKEAVIGGEEVMYRHELTYFNPTVIAVCVHDEMPEDELVKTVQFISNWYVFRVGVNLYLDAVAVKSVSRDPERFSKAVKLVAENTNYPIVLCSLDPACLKAGVDVIKDRRPLLYAATRDNWREVAEIALNAGCPVVVSSPGDLDTLKSLAVTLSSAGIDVALDPGTAWGEGVLADTIDSFTMLRRAAIERGDKGVGWPLVGVPATLWIGKEEASEGERLETAFVETLLAAALICRYADLLIINSKELWTFLALVTLRQNLYTDPRIHPSVEPGLIAIGNPNEDSPVLITTNYASTAFVVRSDLEQSKIDAWLVIIDTEGIGVESAAAGGQLNASKMAEALSEYKLAEKVRHRSVIIPGLAARFAGELEDASGWDVYVGPKDSSGIPSFLKTKYRPRDGLRYVGDPGADSPVIVTVNNIRDFYRVKTPLLEGKIDAWLLVVNTDGLPVSEAIKERKLTGDAVKSMMEREDVGKQVSHKKLIIPEEAEPIKEEIEKATGWDVTVVPCEKLVEELKK
ncbi:MAG: acetyl-CoA decarbonylase/synthase complex subunit gamma [Candidatus Freyarchaeota archaeon]|nr:acetyl-CoA decarbonylase/synthase complex subunit gamma [Candidatus Freyrarchaeum guaymaensis]